MTGDKRIQIAFGKAVRKLRDNSGLSQEDIAQKAGIHRNYWGDVERGERNVSIANMHRIAKALGIKLSELVKEMEKGSGGGQ